GGYNLDALVPKNTKNNLAHILVGSEGTLAFSTKIELKLSPVLGKRVVGVCHFGQFYEAMNAAQHLVTLGPIAVEAIDKTMLDLELEKDLIAMRAIAEEAFALVRQYKGSHSGEHGDGIVRSEFHEQMFGSRLVHAFGEVKGMFDPDFFFNPGKIVGAPSFD